VVASGTARQLWAVHARAPDDVWAVGAQGTILRYDGAGFGVVAEPPGNAGANFHGVTFDGDDLVIVGQKSWRRVGTTWTELAPAPGTVPLAVASTAQGLIAAGIGGGLYRWNGTNWAALTTGTTTALRGLALTSSGALFVVGDGGEVLVSRSLSSWERVGATGHPLLRVVVGAAPTPYSAGDALYQRTPAGTWQRLNVTLGATVNDACITTTGNSVGLHLADATTQLKRYANGSLTTLNTPVPMKSVGCTQSGWLVSTSSTGNSTSIYRRVTSWQNYGVPGASPSPMPYFAFATPGSDVSWVVGTSSTGQGKAWQHNEDTTWGRNLTLGGGTFHRGIALGTDDVVLLRLNNDLAATWTIVHARNGAVVTTITSQTRTWGVAPVAGGAVVAAEAGYYPPTGTTVSSTLVPWDIGGVVQGVGCSGNECWFVGEGGLVVRKTF
jgi:hypothetical protein